MRARTWLIGSLCPLSLALSFLPAAEEPRPDDTPVGWKKTVLDKAFRSEGVTVADVNKDGKPDILTGEVWYEAPSWKMHEIRKTRDYREGDKNVYSQSFACWADDLNGDGWPDLIVIGFPGAPCHWFENPRGKEGHWEPHVIWHSACNETPTYVDLLGKGKRVLVMGTQTESKEPAGQMAYFSPGEDPTLRWELHPISEAKKGTPGTNQFSHGLGVGDVNGDGRADVLCTGGWWEQPAKVEDRPWTFHRADLGPDCADMFTFDVDGDGKADVLSSSAHNYGIWWHQQKDGSPDPAFQRRDLFPRLVSQTHAMHFVDVNGDGKKDLVTGKRWWAHGPRGDADPNAAPALYWFEARKGADGLTTFTPHKIDNDSGIGTQFWVGDVNGDKLPDVVVANKKGVFVFEQVRGK